MRRRCTWLCLNKDNTRIMAYDLKDIAMIVNGVIVPKAVNGRELFNAQSLKSAERKGGCDGLKVDTLGQHLDHRARRRFDPG